MHILDFIMYFILLVILWRVMAVISGNQLTSELGGCLGSIIVLIYTIVYIILFAFYPDWNWVDFKITFPKITW
jgi:hypothetical protein